MLPMRAALRAGVALFNTGEHHAAHDPWEERWLQLERETLDERLLHGLIQYAAAVHHARRRNWSGATGLAESAAGYLADLPPEYRDVNVGEVRTYLAALRADPERVERGPPLALRHDGCALAPSGLDFEATALAALALAEEYDRYDEEVVERAVEYAREERAEDVRTRFIGLVTEFVRNVERRDLVHQRLRQHVERRESKEDDVKRLFE